MVKIRTKAKVDMKHQEQIEEHGYCVFDLTKAKDKDAITPISAKYQCIILCTSGEATLEANMQRITLKKGDCLCFNNVLYKRTLNMDYDFKAKVLVCDRSYAFDAIVGIPTGYVELIYTMPLVKLEESNLLRLITNYFEILDLLQYESLGLKHTEVASSAFRSLLILMAGIRGGNDSQNFIFSHGDIYFRQFVELIDEWGNYIPGQDTVKHLLPVSELNNEIRKLRIYFTELCGQSWIFEIVKRVIRPSLRHPAIYASEIKGIMYICEYCAYNEETDRCSLSYELYLQEGEDPEDYIIPDNCHREVTILPYEEWKRKTKIGISAFKGATGVK